MKKTKLKPSPPPDRETDRKALEEEHKRLFEEDGDDILGEEGLDRLVRLVKVLKKEKAKR